MVTIDPFWWKAIITLDLLRLSVCDIGAIFGLKPIYAYLFASRRGQPFQVWSNNAKTFVTISCAIQATILEIFHSSCSSSRWFVGSRREVSNISSSESNKGTGSNI